MKFHFSLIGLLAFAISCRAAQATASAQRQHPAVQPGGVRVGKHQLGESFKKWLAISGIDLEEICPSDDHSDARCAQLLPIEDSGHGEAKEDSQEPLGTWLFEEGKLAKYSLEYANSCNGFDQNAPLIGALDELDLFNRALDATEIEAIYRAGPAGKCK